MILAFHFFEKVDMGEFKKIKDGQISLYCHFNKIIKEPGTSFQTPELNQKTC